MTLIDKHINDIEIKSYIEAIKDIANNKSWNIEQKKNQIHGVSIAAGYDERINIAQFNIILKTKNTFIETLK